MVFNYINSVTCLSVLLFIAQCYAEHGYTTINCLMSICIVFVCNIEVFEYLENNFMADLLKFLALASPNSGDLKQWKHPQNSGDKVWYNFLSRKHATSVEQGKIGPGLL